MQLSEASEIACIRAEFERRDREIPPIPTLGIAPSTSSFARGPPAPPVAPSSNTGCFRSMTEPSFEIGCGAGSRLIECGQWGTRPANLAAIDRVEGRVQAARGHTHTLQLPASVNPA